MISTDFNFVYGSKCRIQIYEQATDDAMTLAQGPCHIHSSLGLDFLSIVKLMSFGPSHHSKTKRHQNTPIYYKNTLKLPRKEIAPKKKTNEKIK
jgi:hypothetical protein